MRFYGRSTGLKRLEECYSLFRESSMMNAIAGRKGIGKTRLVMEFAKNKKGVLYFLVEDKEAPLVLEDFRAEVERELRLSPSFRSWDDFFGYIFEVAKTQHLVVILDEFQNLRRVDRRAIPSLRRCWDTNKTASKILLLCLGSQVGELRDLFTGRSAPLLGRASGFFKLAPLNYLQVREILDDLGFGKEEEKVMLYSVLGGVPSYYEILEGLGRISLEKLVTELFLKVGAPLRNVGFDILGSLGGARRTYFSIFQAISKGKHTSVEIGRAIGFTPTTLSRYLAELVREELVVRRVPVTEEESRSKRGRYFLADPLLRFWFKFVYANRHRIERGEAEPVLAEVRKHLDSLVAETFKEVIKELLAHYNGRSLGGKPLSFDKIGAWWDRRGNGVDVCATSGRGTLVGEVRWVGGEASADVARGLVERVRCLKLGGELGYLLVSKDGFTKECEEFMRTHNFIALDLAGVERAFRELGRAREEAIL